jgi:hypothetical protein
MLGLSFRTGRAHALENEPRAGGRTRGFDELDALPGPGVYDLLSDLCHVTAPFRLCDPHGVVTHEIFVGRGTRSSERLR